VVFCAVIAVIAVRAWPPKAPIVRESAWIPAPAPLSEPAIVNTQNRLRLCTVSLAGC
jgi:hypothetical protein